MYISVIVLLLVALIMHCVPYKKWHFVFGNKLCQMLTDFHNSLTIIKKEREITNKTNIIISNTLYCYTT